MRLKPVHVSVVAACAALLAGAPDARAEEKRNLVRFFIDQGVWASTFNQSVGNRSTKVHSLMSYGTGLQLGANVGFFFLEYNLSWLVSPYSGNPKARDASYFSAKGVNAGISLPVIPIEVYGGIEGGSYKLHGGAAPDYGGTALKLGANLFFSPKNVKGDVGFKAEYRRLSLSSDQTGDLPGGFSTRADTYFFGLVFGVR